MKVAVTQIQIAAASGQGRDQRPEAEGRPFELSRSSERVFPGIHDAISPSKAKAVMSTTRPVGSCQALSASTPHREATITSTTVRATLQMIAIAAPRKINNPRFKAEYRSNSPMTSDSIKIA